MTMWEEGQVIVKIQIVQLAPKGPLDSISSVFCGRFHYPVYGHQEYERW